MLRLDLLRLRMCALILLSALTASPLQAASPQANTIDWNQAAQDALAGVDGEDVSDPTSPTEAPPTEQADMGGCIPRNAGKMSLLGVEYGGGPEIPRGEIRNLGMGHPASIHLQSKQKDISRLEEAERVEAAKAFEGIDKDYDPTAWNKVSDWKEAVGRVQGRIESHEAAIKEKRGQIVTHQRWAKGSQEDVAKARGPEARERAQNSLDYYRKEILKFETEIGELQTALARYEQRLPALQMGQTKHDKAMTPAKAARAQAEKLAREEAAKCP